MTGTPDVAAAVAAARAVEARRLSTGYTWTEVPRWHDGAFWFSDMFNHRIIRLTPDGTPETMIDAQAWRPVGPGPGDGPVGLGDAATHGGSDASEVVLLGMDWLPDGRLLVNSMFERRVLVWDGAELAVHADLRDVATSPINDMVVDTDGRAYITQLGYDLFSGETPREADIIVVEPDGTAANAGAGRGYACANGITITADGAHVITAEVNAKRLTVLDRAPDGRLSNPRTFADLPAFPDGICLDDEGGVWAGLPGAGYVVRVEEGGRLTHAVAFDRSEAKPIACVFGGDDRRTLYVCAGMEVYDRAKSRREGLGSIWIAEPGPGGGATRP